MKRIVSNEKGVTVLEVVIAVAILVALSIPIGRAIIASSKYQYKARVRENLNIVAESIMENFKAFSIEEMDERLAKDTFSEDLYSCTVKPETVFENTVNENQTREYKITNLGIYNDTYDINVKVTPMSAYSNIELTSFDDFDKYTSAIAEVKDNLQSAYDVIRRDFEEHHAEDFLEKYIAHEEMNPTDALTTANIDYSYLQLLDRTTYVKLTQDGDDLIGYYYIHYSYMMKDYPYNAKIEDTFIEKKFDYEDCECTTSSIGFYRQAKDADKKLSRVYFCYYPVYRPAVGGSFTDSFVIDNGLPSDYSIDFYFLKQKDAGIGNTLNIYEENYYPGISFKGNSMGFYHNINRNISKNTKINIYGSGKDISEALVKKDNTLLYEVDIEIIKDDTVWTTLSSTIKK